MKEREREMVKSILWLLTFLDGDGGGGGGGDDDSIISVQQPLLF